MRIVNYTFTYLLQSRHHLLKQEIYSIITFSDDNNTKSRLTVILIIVDKNDCRHKSIAGDIYIAYLMLIAFKMIKLNIQVAESTELKRFLMDSLLTIG